MMTSAEKTSFIHKMLDRLYAHRVGFNGKDQAIENLNDLLHWCDANDASIDLLLIQAESRHLTDLTTFTPPASRF